MDNIQRQRDFRNKTVTSLASYMPGEQPQAPGWIKLNTNELPFSPSPKALSVLEVFSGEPNLLRRYPSPVGEPLRSLIAEKNGLKPEQVLVANGSDEAISLIIRAVLSEGETAAMPQITYSLYPVLLSSIGASALYVPMKQGTLLTDAEALSQIPARLIFLPNPNAPTGEFIPLDYLSYLIGKSEALWVIDEAYNDFVTEANPSSALSLLNKHDNLIVLRTFSKSHGLAGMRVGYAASTNAQLMEGLYALKDSYNTDALSVRIAAEAYTDTDYTNEVLGKVIANRETLNRELTDRSFTVLPSQANFLLFSRDGTDNLFPLYEHCKKAKILVRHFNTPALQKYLRISIGTREEHEALLATIDSFSFS